MRLAPPTFTLEQAFANRSGGATIWIAYGTYRSLRQARTIAITRSRPCRIVAARVVWTSPEVPR